MKLYLNPIPTIFCLTCFILSSGCATTDKSNWKVLQEDAYHNKLAYDTKSVERPSSDTVKVMVDSNGAKYLYEIDCKGKRVRIASDIPNAVTQWSDIQGQSVDRILYDELCH